MNVIISKDTTFKRQMLLEALRDWIVDDSLFNLGYLLGVKHMILPGEDSHLDSVMDGIHVLLYR